MWLTEQSLELFDGQHRVVLRAVMEVVRHLGHVPRHGPAQRNPHRLTGRRPDRKRPQCARHDQERHGETRGEHVAAAEVGRYSHGEQSLEVTDGDPKPNPGADFFPADCGFSAATFQAAAVGRRRRRLIFFYSLSPQLPSSACFLSSPLTFLSLSLSLSLCLFSFLFPLHLSPMIRAWFLLNEKPTSLNPFIGTIHYISPSLWSLYLPAYGFNLLLSNFSVSALNKHFQVTFSL